MQIIVFCPTVWGPYNGGADISLTSRRNNYALQLPSNGMSGPRAERPGRAGWREGSAPGRAAARRAGGGLPATQADAPRWPLRLHCAQTGRWQDTPLPGPRSRAPAAHTAALSRCHLFMTFDVVKHTHTCTHPPHTHATHMPHTHATHTPHTRRTHTPRTMRATSSRVRGSVQHCRCSDGVVRGDVSDALVLHDCSFARATSKSRPCRLRQP